MPKVAWIFISVYLLIFVLLDFSRVVVNGITAKQKEKENIESSSDETRTNRSCSVLDIQLRHGHAQYIHGHPLLNGSIYVVCENGIGSCYRDTGRGETEAIEMKQCPKENIRQIPEVHSHSEVLWPKGIVCFNRTTFEFNPKFDMNLRKTIYQVFNYIESKTKVRFKSLETCVQESLADQARTRNICSGCADYIDFYRSSKRELTNAPVGRRYGPNKIVITKHHMLDGRNYDEDFADILHAVCHSLGLVHEHQHPDSPYVFWNSGNVSNSWWNQYIKFRSLPRHLVGKKYDPYSIMHYQPQQGICIPKPQCLALNDIPDGLRDYVSETCIPKDLPSLCGFYDTVDIRDRSMSVCMIPRVNFCAIDPLKVVVPLQLEPVERKLTAAGFQDYGERGLRGLQQVKKKKYKQELSAGDIEIINALYNEGIGGPLSNHSIIVVHSEALLDESESI